MKTLSYIFFTLLLSSAFQANSQLWDWAKTAGTTSNKEVTDIAADANGGFFLTGRFSGTVNFDTMQRISSGLDFFLARLDSNGNFLWVNTSGTSGNEFGSKIDTDAEGNVFLTGGFSVGNGQSGAFGYTPKGSSDIFIAKYNSNGQLMWSRQIGGNQYDSACDISVRGNDVVVAGFINDTTFTDFEDPDLIIGANNTIGDDGFIVKYNGTTGQQEKITRIYGPAKQSVTSVSIGGSGSIYAGGSFQEEVFVGDSTITGEPTGNLFILKLNNDLEPVWLKGIKTDEQSSIVSVSTDTSENLYVAGNLKGKLVFGEDSITATGNLDNWWAALNASGDIKKINPIGSGLNEYLMGTEILPEGTMIFTGRVNDPDQLGGPDFFDASETNLYITFIDAIGDTIKHIMEKGPSDEMGISISTANGSQYYFAGSVSGNFTLGTVSLQPSVENGNPPTDGFISRLSIPKPSVYIFTGNGSWSISSNWINGLIPPSPLPAGSMIVIDCLPEDSCILDVEQVLLQGSTMEIKQDRKLIIQSDITIDSFAEIRRTIELIDDRKAKK